MSQEDEYEEPLEEEEEDLEEEEEEVEEQDDEEDAEFIEVEDEEETPTNDYKTKFTDEMRSHYIQTYHPEEIHKSFDEIYGETIRCGMDANRQSIETGIPIDEINKGIWPAIEEFINNNQNWKIKERFTNNNGLTILERIQ